MDGKIARSAFSEWGMENTPVVRKCIPLTGPQKAFIVPGSCFECYTKPQGEERLKTCGGCHLVQFCSKDCQKKNWSTHKYFCRAAKAQSEPGRDIYSTANKKIEKGKKWFNIVKETSQLLQGILGFKFEHIDGILLSAPRVCNFCWNSESSTLKLCEDCCAVYYCSGAHFEADAAVHKSLCRSLKLMVKCDELLATKGYPDLLSMPFPSKSVTKYEKLPKGILDLINIPSNPIDAISSDWLSYPLSILYALEKIGLGIDSSPVHEAKKLTIHMMDCANELHIFHNSLIWEYLFHRLPNLKSLRVVMIDPELFHELGYTDSNHFQMSLCEDCEQRGRKLAVSVEENLRIYKWSDRYVRPDVILTHGIKNQTTGNMFIHTAEPSIPMVMMNVIRECIETDLQFLSMHEDIKLKLPIQVNPFCGQRPIRSCIYTSQYTTSSSCSYVDPKTSFVYGNGYICAMQRDIKAGYHRIRMTPNK
ncbi:unnamed protein product [Meganyctiphanes norvegica]|uniref:MYND-type domain-containing protein n=1 Tax=Meganyctiphanes norvegica TaxID=48144 RepID=A0AAV2RW02_MEGNR